MFVTQVRPPTCESAPRLPAPPASRKSVNVVAIRIAPRYVSLVLAEVETVEAVLS